MAWGDNKQLKQLEIENAVLKREIVILHEQLDAKEKHVALIQNSLDKAYEALTAKESPEAYRDRIVSQPPRELTAEEKRARLVAEANRQLLNETESDLFKSPDDMISQLQRVLGGPTLKSLHGNEES
ncbi:MAG: hypothetical protein MN733_23540 [Nitrososphaera sp.]|nr:hypothetical protein [Nitrososphaera sp.]